MLENLGDGAWCWFQRPRCVTDGDHTYAGWVESGGDVTVAQFDHGRERWDLNRGIDTIDYDDHGSPAIHVRRDGRVLFMYMRHNDDTFRYRVTTDPQDVTSLGPVREFDIDGGGGNYPQFVDAGDDGPLYLFHRAVGTEGSRDWYYRTSDDDGRSWSDQSKVVEFSGGYSLYARFSVDGDGRTDVAFTPHPRPNDASLYHGYFDTTAGTWHDSHGTQLDPPFSVRDLTCVWDVAERGRDAWVWDVRTNDGVPEVLYATIATDDVTDHRYQHSRFRDGAWETTAVADTHQLVARNASIPEDHYSPGIQFDHQRPGDLLLSRNPNPRSRDEHDTRRGVELERWRIADDGEARRVEALTADSETNQFRPVTPAPCEDGQSSPVEALWMHDQDGEVYEFDAFTTDIRAKRSE
jgi:hypothetical protein